MGCEFVLAQQGTAQKLVGFDGCENRVQTSLDMGRSSVVVDVDHR